MAAPAAPGWPPAAVSPAGWAHSAAAALTSFVCFWHRLGNHPDGIDRALAGPRVCGGRPVCPGVELDLKWLGERLYAHHGPTGRERLGAAALARSLDRGEAVELARLLAHPRAGELRYLVELKVGRGEPGVALRALRRLVEAGGLAERVWVAASSLELLALAQAELPAWPRVLFAAPSGLDRVWHRPTTQTLRSLRLHGVRPRLPAGRVDWLCTVGVRPRSLEGHAALAAAAAARGLGYLPGRVTTWATLEGLARAGYAGAFVYADPVSPGPD